MIGRDLLTSDQAAKHLGICTRTLRNLRKSGAVPYIALGPRQIRYMMTDLSRYLDGCRRRDEPAQPRSPVGRRISSVCGKRGETLGFMAGRAARKARARRA